MYWHAVAVCSPCTAVCSSCTGAHSLRDARTDVGYPATRLSPSYSLNPLNSTDCTSMAKVCRGRASICVWCYGSVTRCPIHPKPQTNNNKTTTAIS
eukprot:3127239-Rhodomonas_salina.3